MSLAETARRPTVSFAQRFERLAPLALLVVVNALQQRLARNAQ